MAVFRNGNGLAWARRRALVWATVALVFCAAMNIYHYSLQGAWGLYRWDKTWLFRMLILMGLLPLGLIILSLPLEKLKTKTPAKLLRGLSLIASFLVSLASLGILAFLIVTPRMGSLRQAELTLVNPSVKLEGAVGVEVRKTLLRISVGSDAHWGTEKTDSSARSNILATIAERKPDIFFLLGDTVETGSSVSQWNAALADLSAIVPKVPLRPLMGNHDALFGGQYLFKKAFFPKEFSSDSGSPYYYSIQTDAATLVVLDLPWGTENFDRRQKSWLESTLSVADPLKPLIVFSHSFFYASGYDSPELDKPWYDHYQNIPALSPLFERYGVDLVVSGHNHYMEYLEKNGVRYAVVGAMGSKSDPVPKYWSPASKWIAVASFGHLNIDIGPDDITLEFEDQLGNTLHEERFGYKPSLLSGSGGTSAQP
jgi:predicted MPP superfamily phosphohydrolase